MPGHQVRRARAADAAPLLALWEKSVRATHDFLTEADIDVYRPLVARMFTAGTLDLWLLVEDGSEAPVGFLAVSPNTIEGLFLDPDFRGQGLGRRLVEHAQALWPGALAVDVNEQNVSARRFYEALGFVCIGRSALDDTGRPHPVLRLRRTGPREDVGHALDGRTTAFDGGKRW